MPARSPAPRPRADPRDDVIATLRAEVTRLRAEVKTLKARPVNQFVSLPARGNWVLDGGARDLDRELRELDRYASLAAIREDRESYT